VKKSTRTILHFDEDRMEQIKTLRSAFSPETDKDISNREFFLIACTYGFSKSNLNEYVRTKNQGVRMEYFNESDDALFLAIASATFGEDAELLDAEAIYDLAEQYASGGVILLNEAYNRERNFLDWFQAEVFEQLNTLSS
jgi:hypothetical protein